MIEFPSWSDLGMDYTSPQTRNTWDYSLMMAERYRYYFDGDVFQEKLPLEEDFDEDPPLRYPVAINLVKMLAIAMADSAFGEWEELPVIFNLRKDIEASSSDTEAARLANTILEESGAGTMLWEHELERNVFGGGPLKISPTLNGKGHIRISRVPRWSFFPIWDADDPDTLLEAYIVTFMTRDQARAKYKYETELDVVQRIEKWTRTEYKSILDGHELKQFSGVNPWGIVPFVYTPRFRFADWYGASLTEELMHIQDELCARLADLGDVISYNSHPIRWGLNMPRDFNAKNYPLGANSFWNLGRALAGSPEPKVGILETTSALNTTTFDYIKFVYDWARTSVNAPPIAFGEDNGGGQRSGVTLEIRMWPLLKAVRRSRSYLQTSLQRAMRIAAIMLEQKKFSDVPVRAVQSLKESRVVPNFFPIMPRDQAAIVDEVNKLGSMSPPMVSVLTAQDLLGRGPNEVERIKADLKDDALVDKREKPVENVTAPKQGAK